MAHFDVGVDRRQWLRSTIAGTLAAGPLANAPLVAEARAEPPARRPKVAAILTEFTYRSHAHVILENCLLPYLYNGERTDPGIDVVSFYVDQFPVGRDMAREAARRFDIELHPTIASALTLGGNDLAVDGVLSIGEHGDYPRNERGVIMYPRKRFFDEIVAVFRRSRRVVPLFNDKHLSYRWDWAEEMLRVARELGIPFMAGSSVPLAQRRPEFELPAAADLEEAVAVHSGPPEVYDFHGLEVLQSIVEARRGGETGLAEVQLLEGDAVWRAAAEGRWSYSLAAAALRAETGRDAGKLEDFVEPADGKRHPVHAILIRYKDGLRGTVLRIGNVSTRWCFACKLRGEVEPRATSFYVGPWQNRNLFKALAHAIQSHVRERRAPYPVERTGLVTGVLAAAMDSRAHDHQALATPHLALRYEPVDFRKFREMGATWKLITEDLPQPPGIGDG